MTSNLKCASKCSGRGSSRALFSICKKTIPIWSIEKLLSLVAVALLLLSVSPPAHSQNSPQPPPAQQPQYRVHVTSELVLVNVVVRDKKGNLVRDLKKDDFTLLEDGKRQIISTFDFENVDELAAAGAAEATVSGTAAEGSLLRPTEKPALNARDR